MPIRPTLKSYFVTNNIPTEDNFEELIDNSLLQTEDGIRKPADGPIELAAQETSGELLRLYGSFDDRSPALWTFSHKPADKGKAKTTGLSIADAQESRLFIKAEDGDVGIGTATPTQKLDVNGGLLARAHGPVSNQGAHLQWNRSGQGETWLLNQKGEGKAEAGIRFGAADTSNNVTEWARFNDKGAFGIGTDQPAARLQVVSADNEVGTNIFDAQAKNLTQGVGLWWGGIRKTGTNPNGTLALDGKGNGAVLLNASGGTGNVGVGTATPVSRLSIGQATAISATPGQNLGELSFVGFNRPNASASIQALSKGFDDTGHLLFKTSPDGSAAVERLRITANGSVGIGTPEPGRTLDVLGSIGLRNKGADWDHLYLHHDGATGFVTAGGAESGLAFRVGNTNTGGYDAKPYPEVMRLLPNGRVGIGTDNPATMLDVRTSGADVSAAITVGHTGNGAGALYLGNANHGVQRGYPKLGNDNNVGLYTTAGNLYLSGNGPITSQLVVANNGFVGIGIANNGNPEFPLDVRGTGAMSTSATYTYQNGATLGSGFTHKLTDVSIRATNRVVAGEFNANSDARLKTVVGRSDAAADLALLRRLRITDYTMRDRAQFGDRAFKKIIGQELEEVLPQVVHQNVGFLPDIYASPSQVVRQGEALLLALPAGLPEAATAGQRLKLVGPVGEVLATLAEPAAAGSRQLLVTGANELADTPNEVFVFGLEHPNVRSVDYEAVAMLNVSATQALAQQVEALHQQNAALNEQAQAQGTELDALHAALHLLQQQVAQLLHEPSRVAEPA